jgi:transposase InsO family protein
MGGGTDSGAFLPTVLHHSTRVVRRVMTSAKISLRGSQYCSDDFQRALTGYGMRSSMSRKANC